MQIGMVGLGRMGANMVRRLMRGHHQAVAFDLNPERARELATEGATPAFSLDELIATLQAPRTVWLMVPAGEPTEQMVMAVADRLSPGDAVIDGGNSNFKDDVRRAAALEVRGIDYVDVGTSGGLWGLDRGYSLMIGGAPDVVGRLDPLFRTLAPGHDDTPPTPGRAGGGPAEQGYLHCGPAGAGHFVKMVHNGIEYGMMQAFAEGFDILNKADAPHLPEDQRLPLDAAAVAEVWRRGSVISSWLLDLIAASLADDPELAGYSGQVQDSGEGRWVLAAAIDEEVAAPVMSAALFTRYRSRQDNTFGEKLLSAMRKQFGGHVEKQG